MFSTISKNIRYPIENFISHDRLALSFKHFICSIDADKELSTYEEVIKSNDWRVAMNDEISTLDGNHNWTITTLPSDKIAIGCK